MSLPKIDVPVFNLEMPYSGVKIQYRPFTVKEEKILLFAQQSKEASQILTAIKQVITNCIVNKVKLEDLFTFEVDYFFLKLRSASVNNVVKLKIKDDVEEKFYDAEVDLEEVQLTKIDYKKNQTIDIGNNLKVKVNYPKYGNIQSLTEMLTAENAQNFSTDLIAECIESIFSTDGKDVWMFKDYTIAEKREFIESLTSKSLQSITTFLSNIPSLEHNLQFKDEEGNTRERVLRGLFDFFTFA